MTKPYAYNRRARYDYEIKETLEAGIAGSEAGHSRVKIKKINSNNTLTSITAITAMNWVKSPAILFIPNVPAISDGNKSRALTAVNRFIVSFNRDDSEE